MKSDFIWLDGELVPFEKATIHILTPALHYGMSVFEGIRCYKTPKGPAVFRLKEHMERLKMSAHAFGMKEIPYSVDDLCDATCQTIKANKFQECYIRPLVFLTDGPLGLNMDVSRPAVSIAAWEWGAYLGEEGLAKGVRMMISSFTRLHPNVNLTKAKVGGNYVNSAMAKTLALRLGVDEAIMIDPEGFVAECTGENLFMVRNGVLYCPPRATVLEGITRDSIFTLAQDEGIKVVEERITRDQLYIADEVFLCGTAAEVVPVAEIDTRKVGKGGRGPVTKKMQDQFFRTARGEGKYTEEWLTLVE